MTWGCRFWAKGRDDVVVLDCVPIVVVMVVILVVECVMYGLRKCAIGCVLTGFSCTLFSTKMGITLSVLRICE